jgi:hypothetical protein
LKGRRFEAPHRVDPTRATAAGGVWHLLIRARKSATASMLRG